MSYRVQRVANVVREVVSDAIANHLWDPRINRFTSVTRVEVTADLQIANVFCSVMGTESEGRTTLKGLVSARGAVQRRLAQALATRHCPELRFHLDLGLKIASETIRRIEELTAPEKARPEAPDDPLDADPGVDDTGEDGATSDEDRS